MPKQSLPKVGDRVKRKLTDLETGAWASRGIGTGLVTVKKVRGINLYFHETSGGWYYTRFEANKFETQAEIDNAIDKLINGKDVGKEAG